MGTDAGKTARGESSGRRTGWRRWRVAIFISLGAPLLIAWLLLAVANGYLTRPVTRLISERLGRELVADGGLRIQLGSTVRIEAGGLRLANAAWAGPGDVLRARRVQVEIETRSVFRRTIVVRDLVVEGLELNLARNSKGENNWTFKLKPSSPAAGLPVVFRTVSIPNARLSFTGPRLEHPLDVRLASLEQHETRDGMLELHALGVANDSTLELQATSGPFASLVAARDLTVRARGHLGEITLGIDARIDSLAEPEDTHLSLDLAAPQAAYLASRLGLRDMGAGPVALALVISPAPAGTGVRGSIKGRLGEFEVDAEGSLAVKDEVPAYTLRGHVAGPDLSRVGTVLGVQGLPAESFRLDADAHRAQGPLQVRSAVLELADARIEAQGAVDPGRDLSGSEVAFKASATDIAGFASRFRLSLPLKGPLELAGKLRLDRPHEMQLDCRGSTNYGSFTAAGPVQLASGGRGTRLALTAAGSEIAPLAAAFGFPDPPRGKFQGKGGLEWARDGLLFRDVRIEAGDEALSVTGSLGRPALGRGTDLQLDVAGPSAARMAGRLGYQDFPAAKYRVTGRIQRLADRWQASGLSATLAGASLQLDGTIGLAPGFDSTDLGFTLNGQALADFASLLPDVALPHGAFRAKGRVVKGVDKVLRLDGLQLALGDATATLSAQVDLPLATRALRFEFDATIPKPSILLPDSAWAAKVGDHLQVTARGARRNGQLALEQLRLSSDYGLASARGALTVLPVLSADGAQVEVRSPSLQRLGALFDRAWPEVPVELHARLSRDEHNLQLDALGGRIGGNAFKGQVAAHGLPAKPELDVQLGFNQLDLDRYLQRPQAAKAAGDGAQAKASSPARSNASPARLIPDEELPVPDFGSNSGKMVLHVGSLKFWEGDLKDVELQASLRDGRLQVERLGLTGPSGRLELRGSLARKPKGYSVQVSGTGSDLQLRPVPIGFGGPDASHYTASVDLQASGSRWPELAATLNGRVRLVGRGGRLKNSLVMSSSSGFVKQLLSGLNPMATKQPTTDVVCAVYLVRAKDGIVTTDPALVMRTREVDILSAGAVDLHSEKIDFNFKIRARTGLGFGISQLVNPYLKVNGTLANPGVTLDPTGALVNGGAAFATAGLSVVATTLWDRFVHESDPCGAAVAEFDRRTQQHAAPAQSPTQP